VNPCPIFFGNLQNWIRNSMSLSPGLLVAWKGPKIGVKVWVFLISLTLEILTYLLVDGI